MPFRAVLVLSGVLLLLAALLTGAGGDSPAPIATATSGDTPTVTGLDTIDDTAHILWRDDGFVSLSSERATAPVRSTTIISVMPVGDGRSGGVDGPLRHAGVALGDDAHVSIVPPYVILTLGDESVTLQRHGDARIRVDGQLPDWIVQQPAGLFVARLGDGHRVTVSGRAVRVQDDRLI